MDILNETSFYLSLFTNIVGAFKALQTFFGNTISRESNNSNLKSIEIIKWCVRIGAIVLVLPVLVSLYLYYQSLNPNSPPVEQFKFSADYLYRIAWLLIAFFAIIPLLDNFKNKDD